MISSTAAPRESININVASGPGSMTTDSMTDGFYSSLLELTRFG